MAEGDIGHHHCLKRSVVFEPSQSHATKVASSSSKMKIHRTYFGDGFMHVAADVIQSYCLDGLHAESV